VYNGGNNIKHITNVIRDKHDFVPYCYFGPSSDSIDIDKRFLLFAKCIATLCQNVKQIYF